VILTNHMPMRMLRHFMTMPSFFASIFRVLPFAAQCVRLCGIEVRILLTINEI